MGGIETEKFLFFNFLIGNRGQVHYNRPSRKKRESCRFLLYRQCRPITGSEKVKGKETEKSGFCAKSAWKIPKNRKSG
jgi:hypothetical protein